MMKLLDRILAIVQARLAAARKVIADYEAAKAEPSQNLQPKAHPNG